MEVAASEFAFALCNAGSEPWLVREVTRLVPGAAASYRRKGLVTFKLPESVDAEEALDASVFARVHGRSLGLAKDPSEIAAMIRDVGAPLRLHVYARDPAQADASERAAAIESALREELGDRWLAGSTAELGECVIDVIVGERDPLLVATHVQREGFRTPGARAQIEVPEESPSRAYAKLEEALVWSGLELRPKEIALEIGAAPGGAAYALARRGVHVTAVDPAAMDPRVLAYVGPEGARVTHVPLKAGALRREHIPRGTSILLCDANLAPPVILRTVSSAARWIGRSLRAAVLTLKMNDERMIDGIPSWIERVRAIGLPRTRATQLPSNRREICVVATKR